jgi:RimJ/RimL family protein N-acetyltransferase
MDLLYLLPTAKILRGACGPIWRMDRLKATKNIFFAMTESWMKEAWHVHAILEEQTRLAVGLASYMGIEPADGRIEVGAIMFSPRLQRTTAATEAMYLMMKQAFLELGYRRYEWRCNALNRDSISAATRLGFRYEGTFRQTNVLKGHNRDTAWFSIIDREWPTVRAALEAWLAPDNFDDSGHQRQTLTQIRSAVQAIDVDVPCFTP